MLSRFSATKLLSGSGVVDTMLSSERLSDYSDVQFTHILLSFCAARAATATIGQAPPALSNIFELRNAQTSVINGESRKTHTFSMYR